MPITATEERKLAELWQDWARWADKRLYNRAEMTQANAALKKLYRTTGLCIASLGGPQGFSMVFRKLMESDEVRSETKARVLAVVLSLGILAQRDVEKMARETVGDYDDQDLEEAKAREKDQLRARSSTPPRSVIKLRERLAQ